MLNVVPLPPEMIHHSPNTELPQVSFYSFTMKHSKTPLQSLIPAYRRVLYQTNSHDSSPNLPAKTATKKEMVPIVHTAMTKKTINSPYIAPTKHFMFSNKASQQANQRRKECLGIAWENQTSFHHTTSRFLTLNLSQVSEQE